MKTQLLIEQHFHGCFGIDFNKATVDEVLHLSKEITKFGVGGIYPTLVTDNIMNIKHQIEIIKAAAAKQTPDMAKILGVHLEGIFLNPEKRGIHNPKYFLKPTIENYQLVEDPFIKILTLAPEFDDGVIKYLWNKGVRVQAGHCISGHLTGCRGVTHLFNAMSGCSHRGKSTALSALITDSIYAEIIADGIHLSDDALKLTFKSKPIDKIILISDSLPITQSNLTEMEFAGSKIFYDGTKAISKDGTLAGSTTLLPTIIKRLAHSKILSNDSAERNKQINTLIGNPYIYNNIHLDGYVEWDDEWNIVDVHIGE
ncbi:hypothetical protein J6A31_00410 [bacterium]|nr:hypothetical protein [bacterium]